MPKPNSDSLARKSKELSDWLIDMPYKYWLDSLSEHIVLTTPFFMVEQLGILSLALLVVNIDTGQPGG
jgi:hypothetical protein